MNILPYITGRRKGKEAHRIEARAMQDPFLAESLDGYDSVKGDHAASIRELRTEIKKKSRKRIFSSAGWIAAASLFICVVLGGYYFLIQNNQDSPVATTAKLPAADHENALSPTVKNKEEIHPAQKETDSLQEKTLSFSGKQLSPLKTSPKAQIQERTVITQVQEDSMDMETDSTSSELFPEKENKVSDIKVEMVEQAINENQVAGAVPQKKEVQQNQEAVVIIGHGKMRKPGLVGAISSGKTDKNKKDRTISVKGKIVDENGAPLIGASITFTNPDMQISSDAKGRFLIKTKPSVRQAIISFIGYQTDTLSLALQKNDELLVKMKPDETLLSEYVVVGAANLKKNTIIGAINGPAADKVIKSTPKPLIGEKAYRSYLKNSTIRLLDPTGKKIKGKVVVEFHVRNEGRPEDITIRKSLCEPADREAIRLIQEGPDWSTGTEKASVTIKFR